MHNRPNVQACQLLHKKYYNSHSSFITFSLGYDFSLQAL